MPSRKPYPTDVPDEEWAFVAPYLSLIRQDAPQQRRHDPRAVRRLARGPPPVPTAAAVLDSRTLRSTPESGHHRGGYDGAKRKKGSKAHAAAVDTLGHLLALRVTPATEQDRARVEEPARSAQEAAGESVELAYVDRGYTGERAAADAGAQGIRLEVVKHPGAKKGFVLLPRRWVVERTFAWATRFRRLVRDYERLPQTLADLHVIALVCLMLRQAANYIAVHNSL